MLPVPSILTGPSPPTSSEAKVDMSDQLGFDFGTPAARFADQPAGTWSAPEFTRAEYIDRFARANGCLPGIAGPGRPLLRRGLEEAQRQHDAMFAGRDRPADEAYRLWRGNLLAHAEELAAFVAHCEVMAAVGEPVSGVEYKVRHGSRGLLTAAMYVRDLGTVMVRLQGGGSGAADFELFRAPFFLDSYLDDVTATYAPVCEWERAYCAHTVAESDDGIATVPTFAIDGREYVNTGGLSDRIYRECTAWGVVPAGEWRGATYSYRSQCRAWDEGRIERGARGGLVVRIRGQLCVLDRAVVVYDDFASAGQGVRQEEWTR